MTLKEQTEIFAKNLKKYLEEKNLKQKDVAESTGVSPQTFNYWVLGKNLPRMEGRAKAFRHELEHIKNGDFYSDLPVSEKELNIPF